MRALRLLSLALIGWGWLLSSDVPARAAAPGEPARLERSRPDAIPLEALRPDPVQFDRLIGEIERGDIIVTGAKEARMLVQRLERLLPQNDAHRDLRLRGFRCEHGNLHPPVTGLAFARAGLADAQRLGDIGAQIRFHLCEANYIDGSGQIARSMTPVEAALTLARKHKEPRLLAQSLIHRGGLRSLLGEQAAALADVLEAHHILADAGLKKEAEASLQDIAIAYRRMGEYDKAQEYLRQSVAFAEREGYWGILSVSLLQTAFLHDDRGEYDKALELQRRALHIASEHGLEEDVASGYLATAATQVKRGDYVAATLAIAAARSGFGRTGDRSNEGMLRLLEGQVHAGRGDHAGALLHYDAAARAFDADPNLRYQVDLYAARAISHEAMGDYRAALNDMKLERAGRKKLSDHARTQQSLVLQYQFDTSRRDLENARLQAEQRNQQQKLEAIERASRWQLAALVSGGLLLALLLTLMLRQLGKMRRISALALTDALTGVANRRHVETAAEDAVQHARAAQEPLAVLTFDLDWFKRINDTYGHAAGDQVLVRVTRACEAVLRQNDLLGRVGGEEFTVLLPNTPKHGAAAVAERLRDSVERLDLSGVAPDLHVTISLGLAMLRPEDQGLRDIIDRADAALYRAKDAGRNRVEAEP